VTFTTFYTMALLYHILSTNQHHRVLEIVEIGAIGGSLLRPVKTTFKALYSKKSYTLNR